MVCGGGGFIGQNLAVYLLAQGHEVVILDRNKPRLTAQRLQSFQVDLLHPELFDKAWFQDVKAVINLSGKDIFTFWSKKARKTLV